MASSTPPGMADGDQSWKVVVSTAVGFILATFAISGRLICRWLCRKRLEANDYFLILAYFPKLGIDIASILLLQYGLGRHVLTLSLGQITNYLKVLYVGSFLYGPTIAFTKLSILSLYWSAFRTRYMKWSVIVLASIVTAWGISVFLVGLLVCLPIRKAWEPTIPGTCIDINHYYYGLQIPNIATDFAILLLPFKPVYDLQLPTKQKICMFGVACLALLTCAFDIVRLVVLLDLPSGGDFTWNQTQASVWTDLEPSMALLVACLPIMRPLLNPRRFLRRRLEGSEFETETEITQLEPDKTSERESSTGYDDGQLPSIGSGYEYRGSSPPSRTR